MFSNLFFCNSSLQLACYQKEKVQGENKKCLEGWMCLIIWIWRWLDQIHWYNYYLCLRSQRCFQCGFEVCFCRLGCRISLHNHECQRSKMILGLFFVWETECLRNSRYLKCDHWNDTKVDDQSYIKLTFILIFLILNYKFEYSR